MKSLMTLILGLFSLSILAGTPAADRSPHPERYQHKVVKTERSSEQLDMDTFRSDHPQPVLEKTVEQSQPAQKRGEVRTLATLAILFNTLGVISLILSLVFLFSTIAAWPFFIAGIILLILGSMFWSMARRAKREKRREERRKRWRNRRGS